MLVVIRDGSLSSNQTIMCTTGLHPTCYAAAAAAPLWNFLRARGTGVCLHLLADHHLSPSLRLCGEIVEPYEADPVLCAKPMGQPWKDHHYTSDV